MRGAVGGPGRRRLLSRLLRSLDVYVVFAVLGVVAYIVVINLLAEVLAADVAESTRARLRGASPGESPAAPLPEVFWPYRWPAEPAPELRILKDGKAYVEAALGRISPLIAQLPEAQLAMWDLLLLTGSNAADGVAPTGAELQRLVQRVTATTAAGAAPSPSRVAMVRAAVESAAAVWRAKGAAAEVRAADQLLAELTALPTPTALPATSWAALSGDVWARTAAMSQPLQAAVEMLAARRHLLNVSRVMWSALGDDGAVLPLVDGRLLPINAGSHDAVLPLTQLLLHLWVLGGRSDLMLVKAYDESVGQLLRTLLHTRTVGTGPHAMNFTFLASAAEAVVPVATPLSCAFAGVLAEGVRHGAHRYADRATTGTPAPYTEENVLQAAEALAASCFQQYADPSGLQLRGAVYVTSGGPVAGFGRSSTTGRQEAPRSSHCDVPAALLGTFHDLYLTTHDGMYGVWSLLVMSAAVSDHCAVTAQELATAVPWRRLLRELRSLWLLLHRMDCLLYRRSRGTRGLCELTAQTLVSPSTGHLLRLPLQDTQ